MSATEALWAAARTVLFPGLFFTAAVGLFLAWADRKITARIQSRIGPPWWQSYADVLKLMGKKSLLPRGAARMGFLLAPLVGLAGATLAATILWSANLWPASRFVGDLIVVIYLLAVPALALILGGSASKSPFGAIGAGREMQMVVAYELPFVLAIAAPLATVYGTEVAGVESPLLLADLVRWQSEEGLLAFRPSGAIALVVAFFCMQAKLGCLPFDQPEAEGEVIGGPLAEYSGPGLALFKITHAMMLLVMPLFLATLFLGGLAATTWLGALGLLGKLVVLFALVVLVKGTHARLRIDQVLRLYWGKLTLAAAVAVGLALLGW